MDILIVTLIFVAAIIILTVVSILIFMKQSSDLSQNHGFVRSPYSVFFLQIITLGIYSIYWFYTLKKALNDPEIKSLWILLIPIVGMILAYIDFSKAIETRFKIAFTTTFLIFIFLKGIDLPIIQYMINKRNAIARRW